MPKSRPLIASCHRYLAFHQAERLAQGALLLDDMRRAPDFSGDRWPLWAQYALTCPWPLLLERRLLLSLGDDDDRLRRLPVVRLRRHYIPLALDALPRQWPDHAARLHSQLHRWLPPPPAVKKEEDPMVKKEEEEGGGAAWLTELIKDFLVPLFDMWERTLVAMTTVDFCRRWLPLMRHMVAVTAAWDGLPHEWRRIACMVNDRHSIILRTALWRYAAAQWFALRLLPEPLLGHGDCAYQAQLFGDTHLDLFVAAYRYRTVVDDFFLSPGGGAVMSLVYPLPQRVCCAEELPDLTPYLVQADLAFDSGRGKKQVTQQQAIIHVFLCKMMNNICHIRHLPGAIKTRTAQFPVVRQLLQLVIRTVLLGNLPEAHHRLGLAARIRVHLDFVIDPLRQLPEAAQAAVEADFAERLVTWAIDRKYLSLFILREFFIYTCQADGTLDAHLSQRNEWCDYKRVVAYANATVRTELTRQCVADMNRERILWALMDPMGPDGTELASALAEAKRVDGAIAEADVAFSRRAHSLALGACQKILKGRVEQLLPKKMVPNEMAVLRYQADVRLLSPAMTPHYGVFRAACANQGDTATPPHLAPLPWIERQRALGVVIALDLAEKMIRNAALPEKRLAEQLMLPDLIRRHVIETEVLPPIQRDIAELADVFHVVAWAAARDLSASMRNYCDRAAMLVRTPDAPPPGRVPVIPLRYLKLLRFTELEQNAVRHWVYLYMIHDVADNQFKRQTHDFGCRHLAAFLKLKHYFRLVDAYRTEGRIMILSDEMTRRQLRVLRERLYLAPHEATPPALGKALLCGGCNRMATTIKPAPLWIECRNDTQLMMARVARLEQHQEAQTGRAQRLPEYLCAPLELGAGEYWVGIENGERYCRHGKYNKDMLAHQRNRARRFHDGEEEIDNEIIPVEDNADDDSSSDEEEEDSDIDERLDHAAIIEPAVVDPPDDAADDEDLEYGADRLFLELLDPTVTDIVPANIRMPARFGRTVRAVRPPPIAPVTQKKKNSAVRAETTRMLHRTMAPVLKTHPRFSCRTDPLLTVDLVGIWLARGGDLYGLCVYCGDVTVVRNEKIMTHGLSCMNHPHAGAFSIDHAHSLATLPLVPGGNAMALHGGLPTVSAVPAATLMTQRAKLQMAEQASPVMDIRERMLRRHPLVLDRPVACMYCRSYLTRTVIRVIDMVFQTMEMALCNVCRGALRAYVPTTTIGHHNARMIEPISISIALRVLESFSGTRRRKQERAHAKKAAALTAAGGGVGGAPPPIDTNMSLRDLRRAVASHPFFRTHLDRIDRQRAVYHRPTNGVASAQNLYAERSVLVALAEKLNRAEPLPPPPPSDR